MNELSTEYFSAHVDDSFRFLTPSCLEELLRICAPEPPFNEPHQELVFRLPVDQLAVLVSPTDPMEAVRFSILEQLATFKSFVVISELLDIL